MGKNKRPHDDAAATNDDASAPEVPQKRRKHTSSDAELASIYNDLADEVQITRVKAAGSLLQFITSDQDQRDERTATSQRRLIRGLCSGRKAARLGFSIALAEVFRLKYGPVKEKGSGKLDLDQTIIEINMYTEPDGNVSGQDRRDHLLGRRFAYQALLQSDFGLRKKGNSKQWKLFMRHVFELASQKPWLRREIGGMLYDYLTSAGGAHLRVDLLEITLQIAQELHYLKTPEGVGLWLTLQENFPQVPLPDKIWAEKDPLSSAEASNLAKILLETADDENNKSGSRQAIPSFVWSLILFRMFNREDTEPFSRLWEKCTEMMFAQKASPERRALGLQVFSMVVTSAPPAHLSRAFQKSVLRCIMDQRAKPDNTLFEAAKSPLTAMVQRAKREPEAAGTLFKALVLHDAVNLDQQTKTKTLESIISHADDSSLNDILDCIAIKTNRVATLPEKRTLYDMYLAVIRTHKDAGEALTSGTIFGRSSLPTTWLEQMLRTLTSLGYSNEFADEQERSLARSRLMSILNLLMTGPLKQAIQAPILVARQAQSLCSSSWKKYLDTRACDALDTAYGCLKKMHSVTPAKQETLVEKNYAFALLFSLSILQVLNQELDAVAALEDLVTCYESKDSSGDATTMVIEILLSFVSKPSALFRKLAEQVFNAFAPELTEDSLQSLLDILEQKETLGGQRELFAEQDDDEDVEEVDEESEDEDTEMIDVEDASDVEIVNGNVVPADDDSSDSSDEETSDAEVGAGSAQDDEEAAFDKKLAEALGTGRLDEADSDDDGSDMDDDQMMAIEPHLANIFKERQKTVSKKQEKKDAKENIVNFKNRVLDLLAIFVKTQYASTLSLDLIIPLITLVRTSTNKQTGEKAFGVLKQYFEACNKHKQMPQPEDAEMLLDLLTAVHTEMRVGGSKVFTNACSRSSLFLAKALVAMDREHYATIAERYAELLTEWWTDPKSKLQGSVFTEWTSWSITTRKTATT